MKPRYQPETESSTVNGKVLELSSWQQTSDWPKQKLGWAIHMLSVILRDTSAYIRQTKCVDGS